MFSSIIENNEFTQVIREKKDIKKYENNKQIYIKPTNDFIRKSLNFKSVKDQIKEWAESKKSCEEMISIYLKNKNMWEIEKFVSQNKLNIIKELVKHNRNDVLLRLIKLYPKYMIGVKREKGFTPIQYAAWPSQLVLFEVNTNSIISIISTLITEYKFKIFTPCEEMEDKNIKDETIFGTLMIHDNPIDIKIREQVYDYITKSSDKSWIINEFQNYLNKLSNKNRIKFQNKILYITSRHKEDSAKIFFDHIQNFNISSIKIIEEIDFIIDTIFAKPNLADNEINRYFMSICFTNKHEELVFYIINNVESWIEESIDRNLKNAIDDYGDNDINETQIKKFKEEFYIKKYLNFLTMIGSIYARGINQIKIISLVESLLNLDIKLVRPILQFIIHSNINLVKMNKCESSLLSNFINKNYNTASIKTKIDIEYGISYILNNKKDISRDKILKSADINKFII